MDELKLSLFRDKRDVLALSFFLMIIFVVNLALKYQNFRDFKKVKYLQTTAKVVKQFDKMTKNHKRYHILKLINDKNEKFYVISWQRYKANLTSDIISLKINTSHINFKKYLKGFFAPAYDVKILKNYKDLKGTLSDFIRSQHSLTNMKELFSALFLGTSISKDLREKIQLFGVSHLVAISGFHLGVLSAIAFFILSPLYRFFQDRFFPYRNLKFDLSIVVLMLLFSYLFLVGFIPSLLRSYVMLLIGYIFYVRHIRIVSFEVVLLTVVILLSFFPSLVFSISFWFSVSGVFYIFLFLKYFSFLKTWQIFIALNFWVFLMMIPIVHFVFGSFSVYQLYSPLLSLIFVLFYPAELVFHLFGIGDLLDGVLMGLLSQVCKTIYVKTPLWFFATFVSLSLLSVYKKFFLYTLIVCDIGFFFFLLYRYTFG